MELKVSKEITCKWQKYSDFKRHSPFRKSWVLSPSKLTQRINKNAKPACHVYVAEPLHSFTNQPLSNGPAKKQAEKQ